MGLVYVYFWIKRANIRALIERGTTHLLTVYLAAIVIEVALDTWGVGLGVHSLIWVRVVFWLLIAGALFTKVREWGAHRQELYFIQASRRVVEVCSGRASPGGRVDSIQGLLEVFRKNFEMKGALNSNLATHEESKNELRVTYVSPKDAEYDTDIRFVPGRGGVGYCWQKQCVVYFPRIKLRHAVIQMVTEDRPYKMVEDLYQPCSVEPYRSVLSVPVSAFGTRHGVLNFDSQKANAFRRIDFAQAMFFGFVLAQFLHESNGAKP